MKLELKIIKWDCYPTQFKINGIVADTYDFGYQDDENPEDIPENSLGCGNMVFEGKPPEQDVLSKYKITIDEYNQIAEKLEEKLSFGKCAWCG